MSDRYVLQEVEGSGTARGLFRVVVAEGAPILKFSGMRTAKVVSKPK